MEYQLQDGRSREEHRNAGDQVFEVFVAFAIGNDHDGEERHQRGEQQAEYKDNETSPEQVPQFGSSDLTVNLCQALLATHCQE